MPRLAVVIRSGAACLGASALAATGVAQQTEVPAADVAIYRAAFDGVPPLPKGMQTIVLRVDRETAWDGDANLRTTGWACQDGGDPAAAVARYKAMPPGRGGETLPAEALPPRFALVRKRSAEELKRSPLSHYGDRGPKYAIGDARVSALRRSADGTRAAVFFRLALPEAALVELALQGGTWQVVGQCGPPLPRR